MNDAKMLRCLLRATGFNARSQVLIYMILGFRVHLLSRFFTAIAILSLCFAPTTAQAAARRKRHTTPTRGVHRRTVAATAVVARASLVTAPKSNGLASTGKAPVIRGGPWL